MADRFWPKVRKSTGCWEWTGARDAKGYGAFSIATSKRRAAHRVAWELTNGPIPTGLCVLHRCDNPACVRPAHLFLGTVARNNDDMHAKGRAWHQSPLTPAQRQRRRAASAKRLRHTVHCHHCGTPFKAVYPAVAKWCSARCETRARRARTAA